MAIADIDDRHPADRTRRRHDLHAAKARELSVPSSLGMCLLAAILLGTAGWIAFEVLLTLITLD